MDTSICYSAMGPRIQTHSTHTEVCARLYMDLQLQCYGRMETLGLDHWALLVTSHALGAVGDPVSKE